MPTTPIRLYVPNAVATLLTAGNLNSLANNASITGSAYANGTTLDLFMDVLLAIQYNSGPPAAGLKVGELYLLSDVDGTNYPTAVSAGLPQKSLLVAAFESRVPSTSALEYLAAYGIPLTPGNIKALFLNTSGVTLHASASMFLKARVYQLQAS